MALNNNMAMFIITLFVVFLGKYINLVFLLQCVVPGGSSVNKAQILNYYFNCYRMYKLHCCFMFENLQFTSPKIMQNM